MNTQNTPVHIKLWHREFWLMAISSLLLTMSVYMLIPVMPQWLMEEEHFTHVQAGRAMGVFGMGLYVFGALCSWLVPYIEAVPWLSGRWQKKMVKCIAK